MTSLSRTASCQVMVKPIGPLCNLDCAYCYYLKKKELYPDREKFRMSSEVLETFIRQYIRMHPGPRVIFAWQGGEPTLLGLDFFKQAVALQNKYLPKDWEADNSIQTNGTLLDAEWCRFFGENRWLVGISLDGPPECHDVNRRDRSGGGTHERVMKGLRLLQRYGVEYNVLCVVSSANAETPLEVYRFLIGQGVEFIQFIPLVEHLGGGRVSRQSVPPMSFGRFLSEVFDDWYRHHRGRIHVQIFEECFRVWLGYPATLCVFSGTCGKGLALEHNGDLYACDHFVVPDYKLGNITEQSLASLCGLRRQTEFGEDKKDTLPAVCRACDVLPICNGECPKNRFVTAPNGEDGLNYLCNGYRHFFQHVRPGLEEMAVSLGFENPLAPSFPATMARPVPARSKPGRNAPCPCGSGRKFKNCCLVGKRAKPTPPAVH